MIILKTSAKTLPCVFKHNKHAFYGEMKQARSGDVLLLAEMRARASSRPLRDEVQGTAPW